MEFCATLNNCPAHRAWPLASALALFVLFAGAAQGQPAESVERGKILMAQYQCGSCHAIPGVPGAKGEVAQTLRAWGQRSYIAGRLPNRPDVLARWIVDPKALVPGTPMPSMGVSLTDAQHIAAYLLSLK
jgi:cytochrome c